MRRSRLTQLLQNYVAGDLDATERADVERLLASDANARALHDEIRDAHDALCVLRDRPEPPHIAEDALPHIHAAIAAEGFARRPVLPLESEGTRHYRRLALAATVLFAVTAGLFAFKFAGGDTATAPTPVEEFVDERPSAEDRELKKYVLEDDLLEAGSRPEGITGEDFFRRLERARMAISDIRVAPVDNALLPAGNITEER